MKGSVSQTSRLNVTVNSLNDNTCTLSYSHWFEQDFSKSELHVTFDNVEKWQQIIDCATIYCWSCVFFVSVALAR